jgi:hypothetical protein
VEAAAVVAAGGACAVCAEVEVRVDAMLGARARADVVCDVVVAPAGVVALVGAAAEELFEAETLWMEVGSAEAPCAGALAAWIPAGAGAACATGAGVLRAAAITAAMACAASVEG